MRRFVLAGLLLLTACDRSPDPPPPPPAAKPPELPALPELKTSTDFSRDDFLELPPEGLARFSWDLKEQTHHNYSYEQESHLVVTNTGSGKEDKLAFRTQWKGAAEVVGGGGRGELNFVASQIGQWANGQPISSEELNKIPKFVVRFLMREDGTLTSPQFHSGQEDPMLDLYFALPSKELKPGERDVKEVHFARLHDSAKNHGTQEFVHAGRRKVGRYECVKLLSKVECETTPPGDGHGRMTGWIAAYFDQKGRRLVRMDVALVMIAYVRREMKPADPQAAAFWVLSQVQGDTRVTILLKD